ncbi:MAG: 2-oxo acid dehydrogenase subunit E2 [Coriobacteriia bacterium]|nr:2-oxo acid dehydrogenase subunit E2 [Coriobacteriia bacterium]
MGDRRDGTWIRDVDPLHAISPYIMPNRAENEAFINEQIDITNLLTFLEKKNANLVTEPGEKPFRYTLFHVICAAIVKTVVLRPHMNRFIQGKRMYQRNHISLAFVVKKEFKEESHEALAFIIFDENSTMDSVHESIKKEVRAARSEKSDNTTDAMETLMKIPRFIMRPLVAILRTLDFYGRVPLSLVKTDPNYASVFISNLGSIKLNAAYHHLNNWGTNSAFLVIGEKHIVPIFDEQGNMAMRPVIELGMTLDERISDGYYYSKTIKLFKHLLENPDLLESEAWKAVEL